MKYLLSTGKITTRIEYYVLDLIKLNLIVLPKDLPIDSSTIGFDYSMSGITKDQLKIEVRSRITYLINKIKDRFPEIDLQVKSLSIVDESTVNLTLTVNGKIDRDFNINLYQQNS